ncbi:MAG: 30S ribosomal protein S2 [Candidatus Hydrogenedentes bacterium]|nr:30S ribosomal protein S2 [Candidatus Hydrogenedentota bacterium]
MPVVTPRELLEAGVHFGHQTRRWNPKMERYIYGEKNGIYIIDLRHTLKQIYKAYALVRDTVAKGGKVLFVGTKRQAQEAVKNEAERCGMFYVNNRWLGGTLTNFVTIRRTIGELIRLKELEATGKIDQYGKKEGIRLRKRISKLEKNLCGIVEMNDLPDIVFIIDTKHEEIAVRETAKLGIPCIGIVDTNADPDAVSLPVPGNDDAIRAISLYCKIIADAVLEGKNLAGKEQPTTEKVRVITRRVKRITDEEIKPVEAKEQEPEKTASNEIASSSELTPDDAGETVGVETAQSVEENQN